MLSVNGKMVQVTPTVPLRVGGIYRPPGVETDVPEKLAEKLKGAGLATAAVNKASERAVQPPPQIRAEEPPATPVKPDKTDSKPVHLGGGWYQVGNRKVRKSQLEGD